MAKLYTKTVWNDEVLAGAERFDINDNGGTPIEENVEIELVTAVVTAGTPLNAENLNNIEEGIDAIDDRLDDLETEVDTKLLGAYGCRLATTTTQTFATGTWTALAFDAETFDDDTMHDNSTNNSRVTIKEAGRYLIIGSARFRFNSTVNRALAIYKNGAAVFINGTFPPYAAGFDWVNIVGVLPLEADDYIELYGYHTRGLNYDVYDRSLSVTKYI